MITGKDIKALRGKLNINQRELAEKLGVSVNTIQNYESGKKIPDSKMKLLSGIIQEYKIRDISHNNGIVGNAGGHIAQISVPAHAFSKIINDDGIEVTCDPVPDMDAQQTIIDLKNKIKLLESKIEHKDELMNKMSEEIEFLRGVIKK